VSVIFNSEGNGGQTFLDISVTLKADLEDGSGKNDVS
jgi:hypothetical protein